MRRHVYLFAVLLCMLSYSCRSSHQVVKESGHSTEQSASGDSSSTKRTSAAEGEQRTELFNNEFEDMEFTQVHERDSAGNEKTTTTIRAGRQRNTGSRTLQKEKHEEQVDSSAVHSSESAMSEEHSREKDISKEPAPIMAAPQTGGLFWLIILFVVCLPVLIWPEPVRKAGRWVLRQLGRLVGWRQ